ncbi:MAG TPA: DNA repair protein RecO [Capsulimonadaceae bacterium]|nr:DNA repair protein RecO [Capsulimonadaceae bacterium]
MPHYNATAIVLRRLHFGETDNILTLYTRERGRISAIAKGARKPISRLSGATEALTCVRFGLATGNSMDIVTQAEVKESFPLLRHDLQRLAHGMYFAELLSHSVADEDPNPYLFDLLMSGLFLLQRVTPPESGARWFELILLRDLGYAPQLEECVYCQTPLPADQSGDSLFALSNSQGGALCPIHAHPDTYEDHSALSHSALSYLQALSAIPMEQVSAVPSVPAPVVKAQDQARMALRRYIRCHLERDLKSLDFLDSLRFAATSEAA